MDSSESFYYAWHRRRLSEIVGLVDALNLHSKVLDIGAFYGHLSSRLQGLGFEVSAVDAWREVLLYRERYNRLGIELKGCDLDREGLPFDANLFDCVVFAEVLEHLQPSSVARTLSEIGRVLKPGGFLVLTTPNRFNLGSRLKMLFGAEFLDRNHVREYSLEEVEAFFPVLVVNEKIDLAWKLDIWKAYYSLAVDCFTGGAAWRKVVKPLMLPFRLLNPRLRTTIFLVAVKRSATNNTVGSQRSYSPGR